MLKFVMSDGIRFKIDYQQTWNRLKKPELTEIDR